MRFCIEWPYPVRGGGYRKFPQTYSLVFSKEQSYVRAPSFCAGSYISNLINACRVDKNVEGYLGSDAYAAWREIVSDGYSDGNYFEGNNKYVLYDSMAFPAFCIYRNIRTMLKEVGDSLVNRNFDNLSQRTKSFLGERTISELRAVRAVDNQYRNVIPRLIQPRINEYIAAYNDFLSSARGDINADFYNRLRMCLEWYNDDDHKLIQEYLSNKNKDARCFATFIKREDNKKFVSFSGTLDAKNRRILEWLGRDQASDFYEIAREICEELGAEFVPINLDTRKYFINDYHSVIICRGDSIEDMINRRVESSEVKGDYSCCERKIFAHFKDNTPDGDLYVKLEICARCALGLAYQMRNGNDIILHDGLGCY